MMSNAISRLRCAVFRHASLNYKGKTKGLAQKMHHLFTVAAHLFINHESGKYKGNGYLFYSIWSIYGRILEKILCPVLEILNLKQIPINFPFSSPKKYLDQGTYAERRTLEPYVVPRTYLEQGTVSDENTW